MARYQAKDRPAGTAGGPAAGTGRSGSAQPPPAAAVATGRGGGRPATAPPTDGRSLWQPGRLCRGKSLPAPRAAGGAGWRLPPPATLQRWPNSAGLPHGRRLHWWVRAPAAGTESTGKRLQRSGGAWGGRLRRCSQARSRLLGQPNIIAERHPASTQQIASHLGEQ